MEIASPLQLPTILEHHESMRSLSHLDHPELQTSQHVSLNVSQGVSNTKEVLGVIVNPAHVIPNARTVTAHVHPQTGATVPNGQFGHHQGYVAHGPSPLGYPQTLSITTSTAQGLQPAEAQTGIQLTTSITTQTHAETQADRQPLLQAHTRSTSAFSDPDDCKEVENPPKMCATATPQRGESKHKTNTPPMPSTPQHEKHEISTGKALKQSHSVAGQMERLAQAKANVRTMTPAQEGVRVGLTIGPGFAAMGRVGFGLGLGLGGMGLGLGGVGLGVGGLGLGASGATMGTGASSISVVKDVHGLLFR